MWGSSPEEGPLLTWTDLSHSENGEPLGGGFALPVQGTTASTADSTATGARRNDISSLPVARDSGERIYQSRIPFVEDFFSSKSSAHTSSSVSTETSRIESR